MSLGGGYLYVCILLLTKIAYLRNNLIIAKQHISLFHFALVLGYAYVCTCFEVNRIRNCHMTNTEAHNKAGKYTKCIRQSIFQISIVFLKDVT